MPHQNLIVDGEKWPSATELTALLPQPWLWAWYRREVEKNGWNGWLANKKKSDEGMALGTKVHSYLDNWIHGITTDIDTSSEEFKIATALWTDVNTVVDEWIEGDIHLKNAELKIHGNCDAIFKRSGAYRVGDFKTSNKKDPSHPIQLCVYALCWNSGDHPDKINDGDIWRINKETKKCTIDVYPNLKQYIPVIKALRIVWKYLNKGKKSE